MSMLRFVAAGICLAPFLIFAGANTIRLGAAAPMLDKIRGSVRKPASIAGGRRAAVVFGAFQRSTPCQEEVARVTRLDRAMAKLQTSLLVVTSQSETNLGQFCPEAAREFHIVYDHEKQVVRAFEANENRMGVLIDENGVTRRVVRTNVEFERTLADGVRLWIDGKAVYDAQCARCHGADGSETTYPEIKSLLGIGNRLSESEILRRTSLTGAVDMSGWTERQSQALAVYVAGL